MGCSVKSYVSIPVAFVIIQSIFIFADAIRLPIETQRREVRAHLQRADGLLFSKEEPKNYLPIVIWHGMGDSCCSEYSIGAVKKYIKQLIPNTFVHSIKIGNSEEEDILSSYFGRVDDHVDKVCHDLRSIPALQDGYVALGFSQGGQFLRAVLQRCQHLGGPQMHSLITMGAQHQGIQEIPGCYGPSFNTTISSWGCKLIQKMLGYGAYISFVQTSIVQAQYYKDPTNIDAYYKYSAFLADINVESSFGGTLDDKKYQQYKLNMLSLQKLVLFVFDNDVTVVPKESSHFGWFDGEKLVPLQESKLYIEDWLGLKQLNDEKKLIFEHAPGFHMQFTLDWFGQHVVIPYLSVIRHT